MDIYHNIYDLAAPRIKFFLVRIHFYHLLTLDLIQLVMSLLLLLQTTTIDQLRKRQLVGN